MKISQILRPEAVVPELHAEEKMGVLRELSETIAAMDQSIDGQEVLKALANRERLGSTGIGHGVAIPHTKLPGLSRIHAAFGRSARGVDFESIDGQPAHLFFVLIAPDKKVGSHLAALERASRLLHNEDNRHRLLQAPADMLFETIREADEEA